MLINPNHISESSNARKKPPSLFHVHGLWCIVPFLFLLFDDPRFNFHDAKLMYANGRLIHAGRETSEDSNNGDAFLRHTRKHREERRKRLSTFGKAQTRTQVFKVNVHAGHETKGNEEAYLQATSHRSWERRWGSWRSCWGGGSPLWRRSASLSFRARTSLVRWCQTTGRLSPCRCLWGGKIW